MAENGEPQSNVTQDNMSDKSEQTIYDVVVVGGTAGGLSLAIDAQYGGLPLVRVLESRTTVAFPHLIGERMLDVGFGETISSVELDGDHVVVTTNKQSYRSRSCLIANRGDNPSWQPPVPVEARTPDVAGRIVVDTLPEHVDELDVLVIGHTDHAVELTATLAARGARPVLAAKGMDATLLSPAADAMLRRLERERKATLLYRSIPDQIGEAAGLPMAFFNDRRTPDLQFDHVVFASGRTTPSAADANVSDAALASGLVWFLGEAEEGGPATAAPGASITDAMANAIFTDLERVARPSPAERRRRHTAAIDELREEHYNATITHFEPSHSDLWVLRVKPDHGDVSHLPGQYASLGLGYWEERIDDAVDPGLDDKWEKLIRRSYSISSRMFDEHGYLTDEGGLNELEFYIVLVPPTPDNVPGLTPRLALKRPGDRIYLGPKVAGRYTLNPVTNPSDAVLFFSTGTGEAPHNAMVVELLRKGHTGPIVSAVSVRQWADLGYRAQHETLAERHANYHYIPMPTRESDVPKKYIQDLVRENVFEPFGVDLDPASTHVFMCGNPAMIGIPEKADGADEGAPPVFPETTGVVELLVERGFTVDHRNEPGNIHFEEYW